MLRASTTRGISGRSASEPNDSCRLDQTSGNIVRAADLYPSCGQLPHISITALVADNEGNLWLGLQGISVARLHLSTGDLRIFNLDTWTAPEVVSVRQLFRDSQGIVWIAGGGNGVVRLDVGTGKWEQIRSWPASHVAC